MDPVAFTVNEIEVLRRHVGRNIDRVEIHGSDFVRLVSGESWLTIGVHDVDIPGALPVVRPGLTTLRPWGECRELAGLGCIRRISTVRIALRFREQDPDRAEVEVIRVDPRGPAGDLVLVDAGLLIEFEPGRRLLACTDGVNTDLDLVVDDVAAALERIYEGRYVLTALPG